MRRCKKTTWDSYERGRSTFQVPATGAKSVHSTRMAGGLPYPVQIDFVFSETRGRGAMRTTGKSAPNGSLTVSRPTGPIRRLSRKLAVVC